MAEEIALRVFEKGIDQGIRERLEVEPEGDCYRLLYSPGLVDGLAKGDVIRLQAEPPGHGLVERGGYVCVWFFHPAAAEKRERLDPQLARDVAILGGTIDGGTQRSLVLSIPAVAGFARMEAVLNAAARRLPAAEWYYGNVYDPIDGVTPLGWWVCQGLVAQEGTDFHAHRFGGVSWEVVAPGSPSPTLLMCLVTADPRLGLSSALEELPLCSRLDGSSLEPQSYLIEPAARRVLFQGDPWHIEQDPRDALPNPLPERSLRLRPLATAEDEARTDRYAVQDTFLGGAAFLRVRGTPLWLLDRQDVACTCGRECEFVACVGYEDYERPSGLVDAQKAFFFGEIALYFFLCSPCKRVVVLSQPT